MDWVALAREFGVPVSGLILFAYIMVSGKLRRKDETDQAEKLRLEERAGRLEAEARLDVSLALTRETVALANKYEALLRAK